MKYYQITRRGAWSATGTDEVIGADLTWQQALLFMASADMNIDYALASLDYKQAYSFLEENGGICWLTEHSVDQEPNNRL